jgi:hypothetical protein
MEAAIKMNKPIMSDELKDIIKTVNIWFNNEQLFFNELNHYFILNYLKNGIVMTTEFNKLYKEYHVKSSEPFIRYGIVIANEIFIRHAEYLLRSFKNRFGEIPIIFE